MEEKFEEDQRKVSGPQQSSHGEDRSVVEMRMLRAWVRPEVIRYGTGMILVSTEEDCNCSDTL